MPISHAIWVVGKPPKRLSPSHLANEQLLQDMIEADCTILSDDWMLIGRQGRTAAGPFDLLAIAPDGGLVLIELKRDRTHRDVVAQALDYAASIERLSANDVAEMYSRFTGGANFKDAFRSHFKIDISDDAINQSHQIVIVAALLDAASERIIRYLSQRAVPINALFFQVFEGPTGEQLLSRAWLIDPAETQLNSTTADSTVKEPWNGEYYVSFGHGPERSWDEARMHGFISAGGGEWYTRTLKRLSVGDRVWVNIPATGYVGVGRVTGPASSLADFVIERDGSEFPAADILTAGHYHKLVMNDPELAEYFVPVQWFDALRVTDAISETGFFGNQNTVCQPRSEKWRHTIDRLKQRLPHWDDRAGDGEPKATPA